MRAWAWISVGVLLASCTEADSSRIETSAGRMTIETVATGLEEPWAIAFLPDGRFLITERDGRLKLFGTDRAEPALISGLPEVWAEEQGGLLDVMVPRDFDITREIWLTFAVGDGEGAATAVGKGRLSANGTALEGFQTLFAGEVFPGGRHFGSRLVEMPDGTVAVTTGERGTGPEGLEAQDPMLALGKVILLARDGSPAIRQPGWRAGVLSRGHRNIQGAALDLSGNLLTVEHGAQGGDELNSPEAGLNFGWPVISYGEDYGGGKIGEGTAKPGMEQPLHYWDPSIAPSGLMVYSGKLIPNWKGDIFFGSLNSDFLGRLDPDAAAPTGYAEERIAASETGRVRDIVEAPDGAIWFLSVTNGAAYRLAPAPNDAE
ncbi:MAG TPA: PQQ-dependent sugar dehydrogenase [Tabrizicola sp.]|nr:PQQ-dependent sugar dehydrogenase [Tabrizicola sp.]